MKVSDSPVIARYELIDFVPAPTTYPLATVPAEMTPARRVTELTERIEIKALRANDGRYARISRALAKVLDVGSNVAAISSLGAGGVGLLAAMGLVPCSAGLMLGVAALGWGVMVMLLGCDEPLTGLTTEHVESEIFDATRSEIHELKALAREGSECDRAWIKQQASTVADRIRAASDLPLWHFPETLRVVGTGW